MSTEKAPSQPQPHCQECGQPGHEIGEFILCPECYQLRGSCCNERTCDSANEESPAT